MLVPSTPKTKPAENTFRPCSLGAPLEQDEIAATVFAREGEDWAGHLLTAEATLALPEVGVALPLRDVYATLDLGGPATLRS